MSALEADLDEWLSHVQKAVANRSRHERLVAARGLVRPIALAQRFGAKVKEIGFARALGLVRSKVLSRLQGQA